jgi:hypothetical protein
MYGTDWGILLWAGRRCVSLGEVNGAEGQNRTGYAGLFRAALYR